MMYSLSKAKTDDLKLDQKNQSSSKSPQKRRATLVKPKEDEGGKTPRKNTTENSTPKREAMKTSFSRISNNNAFEQRRQS